MAKKKYRTYAGAEAERTVEDGETEHTVRGILFVAAPAWPGSERTKVYRPDGDVRWFFDTPRDVETAIHLVYEIIALLERRERSKGTVTP